MRRTLLFAALLLLAEAARADRSSTWWADSSSTASLSNSHARRGGLPQVEFEPLQQAGGDSHPRRGGLPGRAAPYQRAAQGELEPLQEAGGEALQSRISNPKFSRLPASTQVCLLCFTNVLCQLFPRLFQLRTMSPSEVTLTR